MILRKMPRKSMFFTAFSPVNAQGCKHIVYNGLFGVLQGLVGTSCHVHPGQKIVQAQQGVINRWRLLLKNIQPGGCKPAGCQRFIERRFIHQPALSCVQ